MSIALTHLSSSGPGLPSAEVAFHPRRFLIRGPSETGKSYIRDCLWYLLGGDKVPKFFPLTEGYQEFRLRFQDTETEYEVRRALSGGTAAVYSRPLGAADELAFQSVDREVGELLVELSGAAGKQTLRSTSEKGPVTGDDVRHWALLSQTAILSEEPTSGSGFGVPKRIASFNLFLSGNDDAAIQLRKSSAEVERIKGQLGSAEDALKRVQAGLPSNATRSDVAGALARVDETLSAMTSHYEARASNLRELRAQIAEATDRLMAASSSRDHSASMVERFELLAQKYSSDLERLGATAEGVAFFQELPESACPLCGTPVERQLDPRDLQPGAPRRYREALAAEGEKIRSLRRGLLLALQHERVRHQGFVRVAEGLTSELVGLQSREKVVLAGTRVEFTADPKTLAVRRSELSSQLAVFDEMDRLKSEIERLKTAKVRPRVQVNRDSGTASRAVADLSRGLLEVWGFNDIVNISVDAAQCDLVINDRPRLSYGAGRRALYLAALTVALMQHALRSGHPHLGAVVIDSPLKAYADPKSEETKDVPVSTVTDKFYAWLSTYEGPGQVVILENEAIRSETALLLRPLEFTGVPGLGRSGFYPDRTATKVAPVSDAEDDGSEGATGSEPPAE